MTAAAESRWHSRRREPGVLDRVAHWIGVPVRPAHRDPMRYPQRRQRLHRPREAPAPRRRAGRVACTGPRCWRPGHAPASRILTAAHGLLTIRERRTSVAEQQSGGSTFKGYVVRRLALSLLTILVASFLVFMLQRLAPGTIVDAMVGQYMGMNPDEIDIAAARAEIERALGLERPLFEQYASWLGGIVLRGDLGASLWRRTPVRRRSPRAGRSPSSWACSGSSSARSSRCRSASTRRCGRTRSATTPAQLRHLLGCRAGLLDRHHGDRLPVDLVGLRAAVPVRRVSRIRSRT